MVVYENNLGLMLIMPLAHPLERTAVTVYLLGVSIFFECVLFDNLLQMVMEFILLIFYLKHYLFRVAFIVHRTNLTKGPLTNIKYQLL